MLIKKINNKLKLCYLKLQINSGLAQQKVSNKFFLLFILVKIANSRLNKSFEKFNFGKNFKAEINSSFGFESYRNSNKRITDGTSEKELIKAMGTYLNKTGAADYNLP